MYSKLTSLVGSLALASLVSALPVQDEKRDIYFGNRGGHASGVSKDYAPSASAPAWSASASNGYYQPSSTASSYAPSGTAPAGTAASDGSTSLFKFPTSDGFPSVQNPSAALTAIEIAAHGILPNGPAPPAAPAADDLTSLRLIAFNEIFEVAYFTELLFNVTNNVAGYTYQDQYARQELIDALTAVIAQEKEHALFANGVLAAFNAGPILPCEYQSPVSDLKSAIAVARTFTDVVLGVLPDVQTHFGQNGDSALIRGVGGVVAQEGEQNGYYRNLLGLIPSAAPFLTAATREFAFSVLNQAFVVPGSCPNSNTIGLPIFGALSPNPQFLDPKDQDVSFSFSVTGQYAQYANNYQSLSLVFINQQNVPVVATIDSATVNNGIVTITAQFPYSKFLMNGLTIAAVVEGSGPFNSIVDVTAKTIYGPGLIEVN